MQPEEKKTVSVECLRRRLTMLHIPAPYATQQQSKVDSRPAIVIEVGSRLTRVGLAGEMVPREIFRSEFHDDPNESPKPIFPPSPPQQPSEGAAQQRTDAEQHLLLVKFFKQIVFRLVCSTVGRRACVC